MTCRNPIGVYYDDEGNEIPAPCGKWGCQDCGPVKKNQVLDRAGRGCTVLQNRGRRIRALCLTLGPEAKNELMGEYFARFRAWLAKPRVKNKKKKKGKQVTRAKRSYRGINYFWTKEFQPSTGQLHLHVLIDAYIHVSELRKAWKWATYGTSTIIFITKINNEIYNPAGYMTKYMAKELEQNGQFRKGERRFGFSRGWNSPFLLRSYRSWLRLLPGNLTAWKLKLEPAPPPEPIDRSREIAKAKAEWRRLRHCHEVIDDLFGTDDL